MRIRKRLLKLSTELIFYFAFLMKIHKTLLYVSGVKLLINLVAPVKYDGQFNKKKLDEQSNVDMQRHLPLMAEV